MTKNNYLILGVVLVLIIGFIWWLQSFKTAPRPLGAGQAVNINTNDSMTKQDKAKKYPLAKEIVAPSGFVNTDPITIQQFIGKKVILVDFWTYSCINCQRTLPYLKSWYDKYKDEGLEIISIHTPEFEFEKNIDNVKKAVAQYGIEYPVVLDNDYGTWQNYGNRYWPRKYLIDIDGYVVYDHIGEGGYDETEQKIQELLKERMTALNEKGNVSGGIVQPSDVETVDTADALSPETYFGSSRNVYLGNGRQSEVGPQTLTEPAGFKANILYLAGQWNFEPEFAENKSAGAKIIYRYRAAKVYIVASADPAVRIKIMQDGKELGSAAGSDVKNGEVEIKDDRLYKIISNPDGYGEHTLEIMVENPGLQAFTFTFG